MGFGGGGSTTSIGTSTDVALNTPVTSQVLTYDGSIAKWKNAAANGAQVVESVNVVAAAGTTETLPDVTTATIHDVTLTANCTFTFPTLASGKSFLIRVTQDATGGRTVTWPGSVKWPGNVAPTLTGTANSRDIFSFVSFTGTGWTGFVVGQGY